MNACLVKNKKRKEIVMNIRIMIIFCALCIHNQIFSLQEKIVRWGAWVA